MLSNRFIDEQSHVRYRRLSLSRARFPPRRLSPDDEKLRANLSIRVEGERPDSPPALWGQASQSCP